MEYQVGITELYDKIVMVSANTESEAVQLVRQMYEDKEIKMGVDDFIDVDFNICNLFINFMKFKICVTEIFKKLLKFLPTTTKRCSKQGRCLIKKKSAHIQIILPD